MEILSVSNPEMLPEALPPTIGGWLDPPCLVCYVPADGSSSTLIVELCFFLISVIGARVGALLSLELLFCLWSFLFCF
jgi:hypothetical protein